MSSSQAQLDYLVPVQYTRTLSELFERNRRSSYEEVRRVVEAARRVVKCSPPAPTKRSAGASFEEDGRQDSTLSLSLALSPRRSWEHHPRQSSPPSSTRRSRPPRSRRCTALRCAAAARRWRSRRAAARPPTIVHPHKDHDAARRWLPLALRPRAASPIADHTTTPPSGSGAAGAARRPARGVRLRHARRQPRRALRRVALPGSLQARLARDLRSISPHPFPSASNNLASSARSPAGCSPSSRRISPSSSISSTRRRTPRAAPPSSRPPVAAPRSRGASWCRRRAATSPPARARDSS